MIVHRNDSGFAINLTLVDDDEPLDLSNATITAIFRTPTGERTQKPAYPTSPTEGKCRTTIDAAETVAEGILDMQITVLIGDSRYSSGIEHFTVTESL